MNRRHWSAIRTLGVLVVAVALLGCDALTAPSGPAPLRFRDLVFSTVDRTNGLSYGTAVDRHTGDTDTLLYDLYQPHGDTSTDRPLIIWVHGGSFTSGNRTSPEIVDEATNFAMEGYVNVSIEYRLSPTGCTQFDNECELATHDAIADAQLAVRYFRANAAQYGIDPNRIAMGGSSAGAITSLDVGYQIAATPDAGEPGVSSTIRSAVSLSGAAGYNNQITSAGAPALDFHDQSDPIVPYQWALNTQTAAQRLGLQFYEVGWPGSVHVPYAQERTTILTDTTNFLYNTLNMSTWTS